MLRLLCESRIQVDYKSITIIILRLALLTLGYYMRLKSSNNGYRCHVSLLADVALINRINIEKDDIVTNP